MRRANEEKARNADPKLDDLYKRSDQIHGDQADIYDKYAYRSKMADKMFAATDAYDNNPTEANRKKAEKALYEFGYDSGKKAGKELVNKFGGDAVHFWLDKQGHRRNTDNAIERYADYMGTWEQTHM
jgi:hypothetical protein